MTKWTRWRWAGIVIAAAVASFGCAAPQVSLAQASLAQETQSIDPRDYEKIYRKWTRELYIIPLNGVENVLTAKATYLGPEFRAAYVARVAQDLGHSPEEQDALLKEQQQALSAQHEFFVSVMSGLERSDELDPEKGNWLIRLEDDRGRRVLPTSIEKIKKPSFTEVKSFDFDPVHRTAYRLTFPVLADDGAPLLSDKTRFVLLSFSSSLGQGEMRWDVIEGH